MKTTKKLLLAVVIIVAALFFAAGGLIWSFKSETAKMTPIETGKVTENIIAIRNDFSNMYLIKSGSKYIAIDAGMDIKETAKELNKMNINADDIVAVLLTHTDMDHVGALALFRNAQVYLSRPEEKMLSGEQQKIPMVSNNISRKDYTLFDDGHIFDIIDIKVFCILTEGHTSGSICYLVNDKYLFTGDILSLKSGKIGSSVKFFDLDHDLATKSISKITRLPNVEYILTAHFGVTDNYKNAVSDWK